MAFASLHAATSWLGSAMATLLLVYSMMWLFCSCMSVHLPSTCLCMTELTSYLNIYAAVPGHVSNIKEIYMPCDQGMYQTSKGNTCPPFCARCCIAFTVTTGTFDPPTHREVMPGGTLHVILILYTCKLQHNLKNINCKKILVGFPHQDTQCEVIPAVWLSDNMVPPDCESHTW